MALSKQEMKKRACEAIDKNQDKIIEIGDSIFEEPELGYKEFKTAEKVKKVFDELGYTYQDQVAITGVIAPLKGKESKIKLSIMGELDAVVAPLHRAANKETGAAHSCGHNAMIAGLMGVAYALKDTGIMEELSGDIVLMAVPAEEYVEIEYRNNLIKEGKISLIGGKQEFAKLGVLDDIDMMIMQHSATPKGDGKLGYCGSTSNGFLGKLIQYIGKEAHAGGAPHLGVNALNAASIGLTALNYQRETFKDDDKIRVHPIITKGGDLVNVVPADVRLETYIRGNKIDAILDANAKVTRAFKAGGDAVGAETIITDIPGYLPLVQNYGLFDLMYENMKEILGEDNVVYEGAPMAGSTDAGDLSYFMPAMHSNFVGAIGTGHSSEYEFDRKDIAYIAAAKCLVMTAIDLLADGAQAAIKIKEEFKPTMTKEEYLSSWCKQ